MSFRLLALAALAVTAFAKTPVLLSTDVGNEIDDQWAIAYLLLSGHFDVQGIVSAQAPSLPAPSAHSTYKVLVDEVENRLNMDVHPPLYEGASSPLEDLKTPQMSEGERFIVAAAKNYSTDNRLNVVTIGAATDVASAILEDASIVDRIRVIAMGFKDLSADGGKEYNVQNDPRAWQVILRSHVPVVIGSGDVCRANLSMPFRTAAAMLSHGPIEAWLWEEYQAWYFRFVKPLRENDFSKPWVIWDIITLAYLDGLTEQDKIARPVLGDDLSFSKGKDAQDTIEWITSVDSRKLWEQFSNAVEDYERTHKLDRRPPVQ